VPNNTSFAYADGVLAGISMRLKFDSRDAEIGRIPNFLLKLNALWGEAQHCAPSLGIFQARTLAKPGADALP
jgi:hypothetical protein